MVSLRRQELLRKLLHLAGGIVAPLSLYIFGWSVSVGLALFMLAYLGASVVLARRGVRLPLVTAMVEGTRRGHERWPVAPAQYLTAILLLGVFLPAPVFLTAVAVLAFGDGTATLAGRLWGRHRLPWNRAKSVEGTTVGIVVGCAAAATGLWGFSRLADLGWTGHLVMADPAIAFPLIALAGFVTLAVMVGGVVRVVPGWRVARVEVRWLPLSFVCALAVGWTAVLLLGFAGFEGPIEVLVPDVGSGAWPYAGLAGAASLLVESFVRRNDNLWVPAAFVAAFAALIAADGANLVSSYSW